jgi:hypothetical protein
MDRRRSGLATALDAEEKELGMIRNIGTVLLGLGFTMLTIAALIRDPTALDANIGAGGLTLIGIPVGTLGLAMIIADRGYAAWRHRRDRLASR